jgi:hypothetical protein
LVLLALRAQALSEILAAQPRGLCRSKADNRKGKVKIRTGILVAGSLFALLAQGKAQTTTLPSIKVKEYFKWYEAHVADWGCDPVAWTEDIQYRFYSIHYTPTFIDESDEVTIRCTEGQPDVRLYYTIWPNPTSAGDAWHSWYDWTEDNVWTYYDEVYQRPPFGEMMSRRVQGNWDGYTDWYGRLWHEIVVEWTEYELHTGGTAGVNGTNLIEVTIYPHDQPITNVTLWGRGPDRIDEWGLLGFWYEALPDHIITNMTPSAPGNLYCEIYVEKMKPQIFWFGTNITGMTNVIWVGEKLDLECRLTGAHSYGPEITNYWWSVPGKRFADWVVTANTADLIALTSSNLAQPAINFFWTDGLPHDVRCTVKVEGQTLTAGTHFVVHKPEAQFWFKPRGMVEVTANVFNSGGAHWLTTGKDYTAQLADPNQLTDVGMLIEYRIDDLKGFTNAYEASYVQVVTIDWKYNIEGQNAHKWAKGRALDGNFPYRRWDEFQWYGHTKDTPRSPLGPLSGHLQEFFWRKDDFVGLLMWQAKRGIPSVPAPLKVGTWNWYGRARLTSTNTPAWSYEGVPPYTAPANYTGVNWDFPLSWTNRYPVGQSVEWNVGLGKLPVP